MAQADGSPSVQVLTLGIEFMPWLACLAAQCSLCASIKNIVLHVKSISKTGIDHTGPLQVHCVLVDDILEDGGYIAATITALQLRKSNYTWSRTATKQRGTSSTVEDHCGQFQIMRFVAIKALQSV
eukprot:5448341-Amphidinium_carterae.1